MWLPMFDHKDPQSARHFLGRNFAEMHWDILQRARTYIYIYIYINYKCIYVLGSKLLILAIPCYMEIMGVDRPDRTYGIC